MAIDNTKEAQKIEGEIARADSVLRNGPMAKAPDGAKTAPDRSNNGPSSGG